MEDYFYELCKASNSLLPKDIVALYGFVGEDSEFCRLSQHKVRQVGHVAHKELRLRLICGQSQGLFTVALTGQMNQDQELLSHLVEQSIPVVRALPADPHLAFHQEPYYSSEKKAMGRPCLIDDILGATKGCDFVGIMAKGPIYRGFASSLGHQVWFESDHFTIDYTVYKVADRAIKGNYAGRDFDKDAFYKQVARDIERSALLSSAPKELAAGSYSVYLAPWAVEEILSHMAYRDFSVRRVRAGDSHLCALHEGKRSFSQLFHVYQDVGFGFSPLVDEYGFRAQTKVPLIVAGGKGELLCQPRSAVEFGLTPNAVSERASDLVVSPGDIPDEAILKTLGTGVYISNLWYLNDSDIQSGKITGMTRFASMWVEGGKLVAPIKAMRFDMSLYDIFGKNLTGLTNFTESFIASGSYDFRGVGATVVPGAFVKDFVFTL